MTDEPTTTNPTITLCGKTVVVVPQQIARIQDCVSAMIAVARRDGETEVNPSSFMSFVGPALYEVVIALVPGLEDEVPEWKFAGYKSAEAFTAGEYDRHAGQGPTLPELLDLFDAAIKVNRLNAVLGAVLDPKLVSVVKAELNAALLDSITSSLPNSPSTNGGSPSMTSLTLAEIDGESAG